ncbi:putative vitamin H transporter [Aspergillus steynii IBT 23096]|uniref:Putative vitamin H transporter n=1 Tax=Aspergillus steynii IBT 23096 TaxID=1392250 RepID=A0A2I2GLB9_9EURO|nr:putative vitamin H transporter [Aspergillus steynii IBT 23096]PLB53678.1 putative vitamin H transporter [Aspergillus steynii IBT 23096]
MAPTRSSVSKDDAESKIVLENLEHVSQEEQLLSLFPVLQDKTPEELERLNKAVVRKLDWRFLPCVTMMLLMSYLDRINVSNARLAGMQDDLHMTDTVWSAGISLFYVGYIISQVPANVLIAKGKPSIIFPSIMLAWSAVTICMPALSSGWGFCLCRFLVGLAEGPFIPAVSLLTSSWYTREESPLRMGIWHAGNTISNAFSGLLAAGILTNMDGIAGLRAWQWFILLEGIVSVIVGVLAFGFIPNFPDNTGRRWFTEEETAMAQYRQVLSAGGVREDDDGNHWGGVLLAIKDPFTWFFSAIHFSLIIAQSFKDFFPSIVGTLNFSEVVTYLVQAPPYFIAYLATLAISWSSGRMLEHCWHIVAPVVVALVGAVLMIATLNPGARYFGLVLLCTGPYVGLNIQIAWETTDVPRPRTKRAALIAIANCVSSVSHWFMPYFFLRSQEPRYETGGGIIIAGCGLAIISAVMTRWWCMRKNKQLDETEAESGNMTQWRFAT